jgi:hypothetical protein
MDNWWDQDSLAGDAEGATATAEVGGNWWEGDSLAVEPEPTPVVAPDPDAEKYAAMYQEIGSRVDPADYGPMNDVLTQDEFGNVQADPTQYEQLTPDSRSAVNERILQANEGAGGLQQGYTKLFEDAANPDSPDNFFYGKVADQATTRASLQAIGGLGQQIKETYQRYAGDSEQANATNRAGQAMRGSLEELGGSNLERNVRGATESTLKSLYAGRAGGLSAIIAWATQGSYNDAKTQAIDSGMDEASATKYALGQGALEGGITALFQAMGFGGAEKLLSGNAKWQGAKAFLLGLAGEVGEENAVSIAQKSLEKIADIDPTDWTVEQLIQLSADTTVQAGLGFGMAQSISSISEFASKPWPSRKAAKDAGLDQIVTTAKERRDLAEKVRNGLTGQQFTEQLRTAATSPEEADALLEIYKARASSAGESFDDYVGKRIKGVEKTTSDKSVYLAQRQSGKSDSLAQGQPTPVDTPEFKAWFGGSKISDPEGKPLVVYHGTTTPNEFNKFEAVAPTDVLRVDGQEVPIANSWDMGRDGSGMPEGYHYGAVTDARQMGAKEAYDYRLKEAQRFKRPDGSIGEDAARHIADLNRLIGKKIDKSTEERPSGDGHYFTPSLGYSFTRDIGNFSNGRVMPVYLSIKNPKVMNAAEIESAGRSWKVEELKKQGYDGAIFSNDPKDIARDGWSGATQIVAFDPTQIKSAIGNSGKFNPNDPSILAQAAYHGSPYKFDKFTLDKIGTGEGHQAFGYGLYFAGNKEVAQYYREILSPGRGDSAVDIAARILGDKDTPESRANAIAEAMRRRDGSDDPEFRDRMDEVAGVLSSDQPLRGALYKVDLKPSEDEYVDWDKPFSQQSDKAKKALTDAYVERGMPVGDDGAPLYFGRDPDGDNLYTSLAASFRGKNDTSIKREASALLNKHGVRGIRFLDQGSRSKGKGTHNYVIFDDADIVIEEVLAQKKGPTPRGEVQFLKDEGTAIIRAFEGQNLSTLLHETGHIFRRDLAGDDLKIAERWAGARGGKWNRKAEEKFARGFENYLATGKAPTTKLAQVFEKFKNWLAGVYGAIKGTAIDVNISPEMRGVFDRLLTPTDGVTSTTPDSAPVSQETPVNTAPTADVEPSAASPAQKPRIPGAPGAATPETTPDILSQDLADRFRGLANQTALPEARAANYEADVAMGIPERKKWADAEQRAAQRIQADPTGELSRVIQRIDQANEAGGTINLENQEETALVNRLSDMLATDLGNPESRILHRKLRFAFRAARSDQARKPWATATHWP